uniref:Lethal(3)malignant brain tumor-like protein 1 n=1 Tax=Callorhinchus milii TaxID=7868 RepID=A0A4W3HZJ0_CALMI
MTCEPETSNTTDGKDFDIYDAMEWNNGVGTLPGSELKVCINTFLISKVSIFFMFLFCTVNTARVCEANEACSLYCNYHIDLLIVSSFCLTTEDITEGDCTNDLSHMEGICCCENCGRYGTVEEFNQSNHDKISSIGIQPPVSEDCMIIRFNNNKNLYLCNALHAQDKGKRGSCTVVFNVEPLLLRNTNNVFFSFQFQTFLQIKNGFKVGMRLEGVDPRHPSMFCVVSVSEVCGYRLRLHFDGYSECFDFWINIDSPDIHPVGWCEKTNRKLYPPKDCKEEEFNWSNYLKVCKAQAAPKNLFKHHNTTVTPSGFRVGMKLEAVDRKNPSLICVATVTDMIENRFLVHFDNWDDTYDYWCDAGSPSIHPVGWCQEQNKPLTAPQGYPDPENFSWKKYLEETGASPAPARAFKTRALHGFQVNMKLEAVDKRNPMLIRVTTIVDVDDQRIKIHFDGWSHDYDYWLDAEHPDLHPAGWCTKTGHLLQPPLTSQDLMTAPIPGGCPTPGCKGMGHIKGARYTGHHSAFGCPYSEINMKKELTLQDRLGGEKQMALVPIPFPPGTKRLDIFPSSLSLPDLSVDSMQQALHQSVFMSAMSAHPARDLPLCWEQHCKLLPGVVNFQASKVSKWSTDEVANFVQTLPGCDQQAKIFKEEQIDGEAFLLLTQTDIVKIMSIKLGPALKIYNSILMFKNAEEGVTPTV